ncbi:MAG TPA: hypothetical protein VHA13_01515 [Gammaproteobacteria bacterium]|nr:hypothetical protein [Gammaproteobacteria bacterium]
MLSSMRQSISEQYRFFRKLDKNIQLEIIAAAAASSTTLYTSCDALFGNLGLSCFAAIAAGAISTVAHFELEHKKIIRRERQETYAKDIKEYKELLDEEKNRSNELLASAEANSIKKKLVSSSLNIDENPDYQKKVQEIKNRNKDNPQINSLLNAARVDYARKISAAESRQKAQQYAADKIKRIKEEINSLAEEKEIAININLEADQDKQPESLTSARCSFNSTYLQGANCFTGLTSGENLINVLKFCIGGGKNFIGAGSIIYLIMTKATHSDYMHVEVYVPSVLTGLVAGYFGGVRGLVEHRMELKDNENFNEFKSTMGVLLSKRAKIKNVNMELKTLINDLNNNTETAVEKEIDENININIITPGTSPRLSASKDKSPNQKAKASSPIPTAIEAKKPPQSVAPLNDDSDKKPASLKSAAYATIFGQATKYQVHDQNSASHNLIKIQRKTSVLPRRFL